MKAIQKCSISTHSFLSVTVNLASRECSEMLRDYIHHDHVPPAPQELSRARAHHYFTKCFSNWRLSALRSRGSEDHFSLEIAQVVGRELKRVGLMASRKLQATWDTPPHPPHTHTPLELGLTAIMSFFCRWNITTEWSRQGPEHLFLSSSWLLWGGHFPLPSLGQKES